MVNTNFNFLEAIKDSVFRKNLIWGSHKYFFSIYFNSYITHESADFHDKIFNITEDENIKNGLVMAFRGSGKSSIITTSYPIWAILGKPQKKFIVIISRTQRQVKQHLENIKMELSTNPLLKDDLGPFKQFNDEWGAMSLTIDNFNAKIMAVSMEQSIRGMKHGSHRPDLIICDDIEDLATVKTQEGRDKIFDSVVGEIIPAGDIGTKTIFVGNLLHEDSPVIRIKNKIANGEIDGVFLEIPLLDDENKIAWPGKYLDMDSIEKEKKKTMDDYAWNREYLLKIIPKDSQIIKPEWIKYYNELPISQDKKILKIIVGVDLAISMKTTSDYTSIVPVMILNSKPHLEVYVLPEIVNSKFTYKGILDKIKDKDDYIKRIYGVSPVFLIEKNGFQDAVVQEIKKTGVNTKGLTTLIEKGTRLSCVSHLFEGGRVYFPNREADLLIRQLTGFGSEKHDDLVDALVMCLEEILEKKKGGGCGYIDEKGRMVIIGKTEKSPIEAKKNYYRRLEKLNDKGLFL